MSDFKDIGVYLNFLEKQAEGFDVKKDREFIVVSHVLNNAIPFINALSKHGKVHIIPKESTKNTNTAKVLEKYGSIFGKNLNILNIKKSDFENPSEIVDNLVNNTKTDSEKLILDIGGYFSGALSEVKRLPNLAGIIEDTENGFRKYEKALSENQDNKIPIISIARNCIKSYEDYLIGKSIAENALEQLENNDIDCRSRKMLVIGLGEVGRGISNYLKNHRNLKLGVYDQDREVRKEFRMLGFDDYSTKERALSEADVIFCATGNASLSVQDFAYIKRGVFIVSCTSQDDEFNLSLEGMKKSGDYIGECNGRYFINNGNAANFISPEKQSKTIYPFLYLSFAGLIEAAKYIDKEKSLDTGKVMDINMDNIIEGFLETAYENKNAISDSYNFILDIQSRGLYKTGR